MNPAMREEPCQANEAPVSDKPAGHEPCSGPRGSMGTAIWGPAMRNVLVQGKRSMVPKLGFHCAEERSLHLDIHVRQFVSIS